MSENVPSPKSAVKPETASGISSFAQVNAGSTRSSDESTSPEFGPLQDFGNFCSREQRKTEILISRFDPFRATWVQQNDGNWRMIFNEEKNKKESKDKSMKEIENVVKQTEMINMNKNESTDEDEEMASPWGDSIDENQLLSELIY